MLAGSAQGAWAQTPPPPAAPAPGIGIRLLEGPADAQSNPRTHTYIVDHLVPGTTISRKMSVSNGNAQPAHVLLYAAAAEIHDGAFRATEGRTNELTTWMTMSPAQATIQPGQSLPVTVTIAVPADASAGERYAAALAELPPPPGASGGVSMASRVGIRVYLSVSAGGPPPSAFRIDSLTAGRDQQGKPSVSAQVHNTGGRALDLSGELRLDHGPAGLSAGPFPATLGTTLPVAGHESVTVLLDRQLPAGPWDAQIKLTSGLLTEEATGRLTFPAESNRSVAPTAAVPVHPGSFPIVPVGAGLVGVSAAAVTGGIARARLRRRAMR